MKTFYFLLLVAISSILTYILVFSETEPEARVNETEAYFEEYPSDWMYYQRAYPDNYIDVSALQKAKTRVKSIVNNRNQNGSDWTLAGPLNTGGRITDVAISPDSDDVLYVAAATGGIFKTTDQGANWTPIFDEVGPMSIGDLAIAPSNADIIYVGTGEANGSSNSGAFFGDGIYRSNDAGATWSNIGLAESQHIGRIAVDPTNPDRLFVAATGTLYGHNPERGVYRTTNGGTDWEQVLHVTDSTAAIDVAMNPQNTDILYAAMWERTRQPWQRDYAGVTSVIHRSMDGGDTWEELGASNGLPAASTQTGRIGLAVSASDPSTLYARFTTDEITNEFNGLYKSTDNGDTWNLVTLGALTGIDSSFGWYFGNVRIDPTDPETVWVIGFQLARSNNSGDSWSNISGMHVDHHALEYSTNNNDFLLAGNDGGAYISQNGGNNWTKFENLPITQFYNIEVDNLAPQNLYGGTQDNNTIRTTTASTDDWEAVWGGDGFHVGIDPVDNNYIYVESQYGNLGRSTNGGATFSGATSGISGSDRNNWNTPVVISPFNTEMVYYGTQRLYSSTHAEFWSPISPDLTNGQHPSGSLTYGTLTAIAPSYLNLETIYTGSDDGNVNVTFDGGDTWENISASLPDRYVTSVAISPSDDMVAYVTFSGYNRLDYTPHVFKTEDGGQNWVDISGNLPEIPVNDLIITADESLLFVATDVNVWYSENNGANWTVLGNELPMTLTRDLKMHEPTQTLYAGTYGRSIHSYDISTIVLGTENFTTTEEEVTLYPVPATTELNIRHSLTSEGTITVYDNTGRSVKNLFSGSLEASSQQSFSIADLPSGIYFIRIVSKGNTISKQFVVK
ncbi:T9SS type A sorting domain-containing protein [Marixanthomonas ophiurae]|uniref:T9SS C-terminal target domain-containing protein n=1 Tax=Marixanthomonas ophiurae TaxID=387659 RepID=A0A3E1Q6A2_9FLAO|nr:T9SS type A sorting domain-containing protein [Marixanthomonas ophiurae]RFN57663.1 T9SS C-terminal target domain-containing protein [Marixanthomonas ophiurae]